MQALRLPLERLRLSELSRAAEERLLCEWLGVRSLGPDLLAAVRERSKGNPFYSQVVRG